MKIIVLPQKMNQNELCLLSALFDYASVILGNNESSMLTKLKRKIITASQDDACVRIMGNSSIDFESISNTVESLENNIRQKNIINFYYSRKNKSYIVKPLRILFSEGFWYLIAEHTELLKKFRIDFINQLKATDEQYKNVPSGLDSAIDSAKTIFFEEDSGIECEIIVSEYMSDFFKRKEILPNQRLIDELESDECVFKFSASNITEAILLLIKLIPNVKIISPAELKDKFISMLDDAKSYQ